MILLQAVWNGAQTKAITITEVLHLDKHLKTEKHHLNPLPIKARKPEDEKAEEVDNDIFILLESRRKEWDNDLKELHSRITTNSRELREHQIMSENKMLNELRNIRQQLDNRVAVLEKWRWIIVGGSIIIGLMISNPNSMLMQFFG